MTAQHAISEGYRAFEDAYYRGDAEAIAQMYTDDAELFVPEVSVIKGRPAIAQAWRQILGPGGNNVRVDVGEVQECGDWAYDIGRFAARAPDGSLLGAGKYIVIWKRQSSGEWKIHRDIFNAESRP
jgi:uncharacterized protein (TIGR02246 family)